LKVATVITFACGIVLIALGFRWLARGSLTLAPVLLVAGYCVVVPLAILVGRRSRATGPNAAGDRANSSAG